jgi:hypothetical protein
MKILRFIIVFSAIILAGIALAACSIFTTGSPGPASGANPPAGSAPAAELDTTQSDPAVQPTADGDPNSPLKIDAVQTKDESRWPDGHSQVDDQGAVQVEVIPLNLNEPGETLDFDVFLNTHSVDLSMDLAELATLTTDNGQIVQASRWDAPRGGHHVEGMLSFPANIGGDFLLADVTRITLTIVDLAAPERVFVWEY